MLLASVGTACAECAWVLWETTSQAMEPIFGYTTKPDCDRKLTEVLASFTSNAVQTVRKDVAHQEVHVTMKDTTRAYRYVCLPDTVDPRGPKGR